jgi:hypothetical protein
VKKKTVKAVVAAVVVGSGIAGCSAGAPAPAEDSAVGSTSEAVDCQAGQAVVCRWCNDCDGDQRVRTCTCAGWLNGYFSFAQVTGAPLDRSEPGGDDPDCKVASEAVAVPSDLQGFGCSTGIQYLGEDSKIWVPLWACRADLFSAPQGYVALGPYTSYCAGSPDPNYVVVSTALPPRDRDGGINQGCSGPCKLYP